MAFKSQIKFGDVENKLAIEMARRKNKEEKQRREIEKVCGDNDEIQELKRKIAMAYLNKERNAQMAENQFRQQKELVS
jgi:hypothetical protein